MQGQEFKDSQKQIKSFGVKVLIATLICAGILYINFMFRSILPDMKKPPPPFELQAKEKKSFDLGEYIVNLADIKSKRFLKIKIGVDIIDLNINGVDELAAQKQNINFDILTMESKFRREMNKYKPELSDAVIMTLSNKTSEQLTTTEGKELMKDQLLNEFNNILSGSYEVTKVNITEFLIQ